MFPNRVIITPVFCSLKRGHLSIMYRKLTMIQTRALSDADDVVKIQIVKFAPHAGSHDRTNAYYLVTG